MKDERKVFDLDGLRKVLSGEEVLCVRDVADWGFTPERLPHFINYLETGSSIHLDNFSPQQRTRITSNGSRGVFNLPWWLLGYLNLGSLRELSIIASHPRQENPYALLFVFRDEKETVMVSSGICGLTSLMFFLAAPQKDQTTEGVIEQLIHPVEIYLGCGPTAVFRSLPICIPRSDGVNLRVIRCWVELFLKNQRTNRGMVLFGRGGATGRQIGLGLEEPGAMEVLAKLSSPDWFSELAKEYPPEKIVPKA